MPLFGELDFLHPFCGEVLGWYRVRVEILVLVSQTTRYQFSEHHNIYTVVCQIEFILPYSGFVALLA